MDVWSDNEGQKKSPGPAGLFEHHVERVRHGKLKRFGHVERKSMGDWVARCRELFVEGVRGRGRGRKSWMECVVEDMGRLCISEEGRCIGSHDMA